MTNQSQPKRGSSSTLNHSIFWTAITVRMAQCLFWMVLAVLPATAIQGTYAQPLIQTAAINGAPYGRIGGRILVRPADKSAAPKGERLKVTTTSNESPGY